MAQLLDYLSEKYQQETVDEVNRRLVELSSLFEISQLLNESLELSRVLNNVLLIPMGRLMIPRCAIILRLKDQYKVVMSKGLAPALKDRAFTRESLPSKCFVVQQFEDDKISPDLPQAFGEFVAAANLKIAVPFICKNRPLGFMLFSSKLNKTDFTGEEIDFLNSLANLSATSIENALQVEEIKEINTKLDRRIQELKALFDIGQGLSATLKAEEILRLLTYALMGQMLVMKYAILLKGDAHFFVYDSKGFKPQMLESICPPFNQFKTPETSRRSSQIEHPQLAKLFQQHDVKVLIPMKHQDKLLGYVLLGAKMSGEPYSDTDLEFLTTLVSQAVISLENARLFEETLEKQRLEEELNVARTIQKKLLPKTIPEIKGYEIYGMNNSSKQVGGDYYDVIPIDDHRVALAIADVSGKGVPASLLMANLQAALRVMMTPDLVLPEVVSKLNHLIYTNTGLDKFITFFIGILDLRTHSMEYINAGHNNPFQYRPDDEMHFLDIGGIILGIMPSYRYNTGKVSLEPGDLVLTYTDGVNEAVNTRDEEWGEEPMYEIVRTHSQEPVKAIVDRILEGIEAFSRGAQQADDITILAFRREQE
ncbi:MAG: SpoIIE family protein phosphatase [Calditrichae bacterium]|nr:SpoIIE family protein phosphatase [Calditrichia bacterium]